MKRIIFILSVALAITACTGSGGDNGAHGSKQPKREHELRFLRDVGINPDSMLVTDSWSLSEDENWETEHNRWLTIELIQKLALDQLFDADTAMSPVTLMAVKPIDKHYTMLILHQYLGDSAPIRLVTYDGDGMAMDYVTLGTLGGVNTQYWQADRQAMGVETGKITFDDRLMTVDRQLQLCTHQHDVLWTATNSDTYEIDNRGYILHRESRADPAEMSDEFRGVRQLEASSWYSIQDEQAMDALTACQVAYPSNNMLGMATYQRLYVSPWTTAHWFYTHQDSPLIPVLASETKTIERENFNHIFDAIHETDQLAFIKKILLNK